MLPYACNIAPDQRRYLPCFQLQMSASEKLSSEKENCVTSEHTTVSQWRASDRENVTGALAVLITSLLPPVWTQRWNENVKVLFNSFLFFTCSWIHSSLCWLIVVICLDLHRRGGKIRFSKSNQIINRNKRQVFTALTDYFLWEWKGKPKK